MTREQTVRAVAAMQTLMESLPKPVGAEDLMKKEFPPIPWVIPGFITTGLTIVAGAPKLGKSWLILGIAWALSVGGRVFGHIQVEPQDVLFLALEDTERRLQERLGRIGFRGSNRLSLLTKWPKGAQAFQWLDAWMLKYPKTKAIFIDTLQKVAGIEDSNSYNETYNSAATLKAFADKYGIAVIVVHHTRKMIATDYVHTVQGSVGFTGAADTVIVMTRSRGQEEGTLSITGRDVEESEYGIRFAPEIGTWEMLDHLPAKPSLREKVDRKMAAAGED